MSDFHNEHVMAWWRHNVKRIVRETIRKRLAKSR